LENQRRAAAFTIARLLTIHNSVALAILHPIIHFPFQSLTRPTSYPTVLSSLEFLQDFFTHNDPSPELPRVLMGPIISQLYSLKSLLDQTRTADPTLTDLVGSLFRVWGRTVDREEFIRGICDIIESSTGWGETRDWDWTITGGDVGIK
jgi:hypothetical protein